MCFIGTKKVNLDRLNYLWLSKVKLKAAKHEKLRKQLDDSANINDIAEVERAERMYILFSTCIGGDQYILFDMHDLITIPNNFGYPYIVFKIVVHSSRRSGVCYCRYRVFVSIQIWRPELSKSRSEYWWGLSLIGKWLDMSRLTFEWYRFRKEIFHEDNVSFLWDWFKTCSTLAIFRGFYYICHASKQIYSFSLLSRNKAQDAHLIWKFHSIRCVHGQQNVHEAFSQGVCR